MYFIFGLVLFAIFISFPAWLCKVLVEWAAEGGGNRPVAALTCVLIGLAEGFAGYWLFVGIDMGVTLEDGVWNQEIFRMRIAGVGAMLMGGFLTLIAPFACLTKG